MSTNVPKTIYRFTNFFLSKDLNSSYAHTVTGVNPGGRNEKKSKDVNNIAALNSAFIPLHWFKFNPRGRKDFKKIKWHSGPFQCPPIGSWTITSARRV
jgi:hypothetical protein